MEYYKGLKLSKLAFTFIIIQIKDHISHLTKHIFCSLFQFKSL